MILYKKLELINAFTNITCWIQKQPAKHVKFLYIRNEQFERKLRKQFC